MGCILYCLQHLWGCRLTSLCSCTMSSLTWLLVMRRPVRSFFTGSRKYGHFPPRPCTIKNKKWTNESLLRRRFCHSISPKGDWLQDGLRRGWIRVGFSRLALLRLWNLFLTNVHVLLKTLNSENGKTEQLLEKMVYRCQHAWTILYSSTSWK